VFAGVALDGATLREDPGVNEKLYGQNYPNRDIVAKDPEPPAEAKSLVALLNKHSGRKGR
jgi:lipid-binding SYLF domain-containing protein